MIIHPLYCYCSVVAPLTICRTPSCFQGNHGASVPADSSSGGLREHVTIYGRLQRGEGGTSATSLPARCVTARLFLMYLLLSSLSSCFLHYFGQCLELFKRALIEILAVFLQFPELQRSMFPAASFVTTPSGLPGDQPGRLTVIVTTLSVDQSNAMNLNIEKQTATAP